MRRKSTIVIGAMLAIAAITAPTQALAAFKAKEAKEGSVKIETKTLPAASFKVETLEVSCNTLKGEGSVVELPGITNTETKEDLPALTPTLESDRLGFKPKFENCEETLGSEKGEEIVNAEKCQLEMFQEEQAEAAALSFRAAKAAAACVLTLERPTTKCLVNINANLVFENEGLESLKLKNVTTFESEIESGSEVKGIKTTTSNCLGIGAKPEGSLNIKKALLIKGVELIAPLVSLSLATRGIITFTVEPNMGQTTEKTLKVTATTPRTEIGAFATFNLYPVMMNNAFRVKATENNCTGTTLLLVGNQCTFVLQFTPGAARQSYLGELRMRWAVNGAGQEDVVDTVAGRSK